jgi:hypothetical protein
MSAIITDQLRILNAKQFVSAITSESNSFYTFVGLTNSNEYSESWAESPIPPRDSFDDENHIWDIMVGLKKINPGDIKFSINKIKWESGITYDMYRNNISRDNLSAQSQTTTLYTSNYYVLNKDYRVYICLNNGVDPENFAGKPSLDEPTFTDLEPKAAGNSGDGYIWKYLFTIPPDNLVKFDTVEYITVPVDWETNPEYAPIRNNALESGQLKVATVRNRGLNLGDPGKIYNGVKIVGDGTGAEATVVINSQSQVEEVLISKGGSGYTFAKLDLKTGNFPSSSSGNDPEIDIIIPPQNGHGYDIYRELGANKVLIFSQIKNDLLNPDFIVGNEIAQIGIVANPEAFESTDILKLDQATSLKAIKLTGVNDPNDYQSANFVADSIISQTVSTGTTAYARVISYDKITGVLKYTQDRQLFAYNYVELTLSDYNDNSKPIDFTSDPGVGGSLNITGSNTDVKINANFNGSIETINNRNYYFGQNFTDGIANPEVKKHSGSILYVDNRPPITRSINQREDIKIILQF